jgi:ketosteroid isomerase-like protein
MKAKVTQYATIRMFKLEKIIKDFQTFNNDSKFADLMNLCAKDYEIDVDGTPIPYKKVKKYYESCGRELKSKQPKPMKLVTADVGIIESSFTNSDGNGRATTIVRKEAGEWKFVHDTLLYLGPTM